jgi:hypothetical protein
MRLPEPISVLPKYRLSHSGRILASRENVEAPLEAELLFRIIPMQTGLTAPSNSAGVPEELSKPHVFNHHRQFRAGN